MKVTGIVLLNYIRCRRYASLNDAEIDYQGSNNPSQKKYFERFLNTFYQLYLNDLKTEKYVSLSYDFHPGILLHETFHFKTENENHSEYYYLISQTSKEFLKQRYSLNKHRHQLFFKNTKGFYEVKKVDLKDAKSNYLEKIKKLTTRTDDIGRIVYSYAFKRFLYEKINPGKPVKIYIVLLNSDYIYDGKAYERNLYTIFDFDALYDRYKEIIEADLYRMINHIELNDFTPCKLVKKECRKGDNFECKFVDFCFSHVPKKNAITDYFLSNRGFNEKTETGMIHHDTYDLINEGYVSMLDVPILWLTDEKHLMQRYCIESNYLHVHKKKIETILKTLVYPLIYLDFEALPCMYPRFKGEKPFSQSVFQYSIHIEKTENILEKDGNDHYEFLARPNLDNRKELVENMIHIINRYDSSVVVYHKTFEKTRLTELQEIFPEYKADLQKIINRLFDLKDVVKNNKKFFKEHGFSESEANRYNLYHKDLSGSYSLKKVIKIFNKKAYANLEINNGVDAYKAFMNLNNLDPIEQDKTTNNLLEYCKQDTYSMFEIIQGLKQYLPSDFTIR